MYLLSLIFIVLRVLVDGGTTTSDNVTNYTTETIQTTDAVFDVTGTATDNSTVTANYTSTQNSLRDYPLWNARWVIFKYGHLARHRYKLVVCVCFVPY